MSGRPEADEIVRLWIASAEEDFFVADHLLSLPDPLSLRTICFHAQQCAEKYIKALLAVRNVAFPRTHDLLALVRMLPAPANVRLRDPDLGILNRYAVLTRYPGEREPITKAGAERALAIARAVREAVRNDLPDTLFLRND